jgi:hypothetical protein
MQLGSAKDAFFTMVVWTPLIAIVLGIAVFLYGGLGQLEARTDGTSYVVNNGAEAHAWAAAGDHRAAGDQLVAVGVG